ncbi:Elicitin-like protein [Phytophthora palmivora]|uniref:Elicitin-like protein n=1 Tax=Phytophthora palmivora TaxID=4796 RepID=A0A2P4XZ12_9STRA|nr:Elicitin-like protein [Phytophthora palmivora]
MKTTAFVSLAIAGAAVAVVYAVEQCDMGAIEGSLLPNGTTWHDSCTAATGVDVFQMSMFPTKAVAKNVSQSRDCVNYINQLNQNANSEIQCETQVGDQSIILSKLLTDLLKGQSSNKTKETVVGSDSMSGSVSLSASDSGSESASTSEFASDSESAASSSGSEEVGSSSADKLEGSKSASKSAGVAITATFSVVAAAATTVLAFSL